VDQPIDATAPSNPVLHGGKSATMGSFGKNKGISWGNSTVGEAAIFVVKEWWTFGSGKSWQSWFAGKSACNDWLDLDFK
jgi:hypothetical protein